MIKYRKYILKDDYRSSCGNKTYTIYKYDTETNKEILIYHVNNGNIIKQEEDDWYDYIPVHINGQDIEIELTDEEVFLEEL